jgi:hypothetical protein
LILPRLLPRFCPARFLRRSLSACDQPRLNLPLCVTGLAFTGQSWHCAKKLCFGIDVDA